MCLPNAKHVYKVEKEWEHAGLLCAVVQGREGSNRCGYVRVPPTHPHYKKDYNDVDVDVHGGLTFAAIEPCVEHEDGIGWWFGFDCAHCYDASIDPQFNQSWSDSTKQVWEIHQRYLISGEHFWSHEEVVAETERLAAQLAAQPSPAVERPAPNKENRG
jgi:hypothetical protein